MSGTRNYKKITKSRARANPLEGGYREKGLSSLGYKLEERPAGWRSNIQILIWNILSCQINEKTTEGSHL